jgi:predicted sulfurtransferase
LQEAQVSTCHRLGLKGRIRLSSEGVNGVLSGDIRSLKEYEDELRSLLFPPMIAGRHESDMSDTLRYGQTLDVKYCHMRRDIPREKQLFDSLQVCITKDVVTLIDQPNSRLKKKKGYKPDLKLLFDQYDPSPHLTPEEWNRKLLQYSRPTTIDDSNTLTSSNRAILIDARNIYESSIGHFQVHGIPTLLTNTRNYSDLTDILEASMNQLSGKKYVFIICCHALRSFFFFSQIFFCCNLYGLPI